MLTSTDTGTKIIRSPRPGPGKELHRVNKNRLNPNNLLTGKIYARRASPFDSDEYIAVSRSNGIVVSGRRRFSLEDSDSSSGDSSSDVIEGSGPLSPSGSSKSLSDGESRSADDKEESGNNINHAEDNIELSDNAETKPLKPAAVHNILVTSKENKKPVAPVPVANPNPQPAAPTEKARTFLTSLYVRAIGRHNHDRSQELHTQKPTTGVVAPPLNSSAAPWEGSESGGEDDEEDDSEGSEESLVATAEKRPVPQTAGEWIRGGAKREGKFSNPVMRKSQLGRKLAKNPNSRTNRLVPEKPRAVHVMGMFSAFEDALDAWGEAGQDLGELRRQFVQSRM